MQNYLKASQRNILWWPINQICVGCNHKVNLCLEELQKEGLFEDISPLDPIKEANAPLIYHASRCNLNHGLSNIQRHNYTCPDCTLKTS
jgi:hypothetical protein